MSLSRVNAISDSVTAISDSLRTWRRSRREHRKEHQDAAEQGCSIGAYSVASIAECIALLRLQDGGEEVSPELRAKLRTGIGQMLDLDLQMTCERCSERESIWENETALNSKRYEL